MNVYIHFRNVPNNQDAREYIQHKLSFSLRRFEHQIESVSVTLSDANGPKGGIDQRCVFVIKPAGLQEIVINEAQATQESAINRCVSRASMALARQLKRRQRAEQNNARVKRSLLRSNTFEADLVQDIDSASDDHYDSYAAQSLKR